MNTKRKGNRNEHRTRDWLLKCKTSHWDYSNRFDSQYYYREAATAVVEARASLGPFDLIAIFPHHHDYIQVKSNCWPRPPERQKMLADIDMYPPDVRIVCFRWDDRNSEPKIKFL